MKKSPWALRRLGPAFAAFALLLLAASVATGAAPAPAKRAEPIVPRVDHHQHLVSPAGAEFLNHPPLPAVELPQELARLLRVRAERWNDRTALADLYTEDSLVLDAFSPRWIRGRAAAAEYVSTLFARAYHMTPLAYASAGSTGHLAGYFTRGDGADTRHFGTFYLELVRSGDGAWRIAVETPRFPGPPIQEQISGEQLVELLDTAGIARAVVLSEAFWFDGTQASPGADAYAKVRAENNWTAREAARFPGRLVAFCSFNPLADYALAELERCAGNPHLKGLKLHFDTSGVDVKNPEHVAKVRRVFEAANRHRLPVTAHTRAGDAYGREHVEIFLDRILPAAPDIPVQIAHLWGGGAYSDTALAAYADAVSAGHPATKNLYFDVSDAAHAATGSEEISLTLARRIRQIGLRRILYGSDAVGAGHPPPREAWAAFRKAIPLTDEELRTIAGNVASYLRSP